MPDAVAARLAAMDVTVTVGGRPWRRVANLSTAGSADGVFALVADAAGVAHVSFGDGVHGMRPPAGGAIDVAYRAGGGAAGRVGAVAPLASGARGIAVAIPASHSAVAVRVAHRTWPP